MRPANVGCLSRAGHGLFEGGVASAAPLEPTARQCPGWVKIRLGAVELRCPFFPRKRTFIRATVTSALCHEPTSGRVVDGPRWREAAGCDGEAERRGGQNANSKLACATNFPVDTNDTRVSVKADALPKRKTSAFR